MNYYKYIDENTMPKKAPYPLVIDGKIHCTKSESIYNSQGYYRLEREPIPDEENEYIPYYEEATPEKPYHLIKWRMRKYINSLNTVEDGE